MRVRDLSNRQVPGSLRTGGGKEAATVAVTARNDERITVLRQAREHGDEYASAIGMIDAVVRYPDSADAAVQQVREILAALDEVTGYQND